MTWAIRRAKSIAPASVLRGLLRLASFYYIMVVGCLCFLAVFGGIFGLRANIIDSSSMAPTISRGSILLSKSSGSPGSTTPESPLPKDGDLLLFDRGDRTIAHRIVATEDEGYVTKSDSADHRDQFHVGHDDVLGIGQAAIPFVGLPALWFGQNRAKFMVWSLLTIAASTAAVPRPIRKRLQAPTTVRRPSFAPRLLLTAMVTAPLLLSLSITMPLPTASGEYTTSTTNDSNSWGTGQFVQYGLMSFGAEQAAGLQASTYLTPHGFGTDVWTTIDAGRDHMCGIRNDGTAWCLGSNVYGQLGEGSTTDRALAPVGGDTRWDSLKTGNYHTCATKTNDTLWCWGVNDHHELGDGTTTNRELPTQPVTSTDWDSIAATGKDHSCATKTDGTLWCWGNNNSGQLGDGTFTNRSTPTQVNADTDWGQTASAWRTTCSIKATGSLWCWGDNGDYQLGDGTTVDRTSPGQVGTDTNWATIDPDRYHTCGTRTDGTLWCWGNNTYGALGDGTTTNRSTPTQVGTDTNWATVNAAQNHSCGTRTDGTLWCWGTNTFGQLGDGTTTTQTSPTQIGTNTDWQAPIGGVAWTCGTKTDGTLWCWGDNFVENLTTAPNYMPAPAQYWKGVDGGTQHTCGVDAAGRLFCWGLGSSGQLGDGTGVDQMRPVVVGADTNWATTNAGGYHSCGTKTDGTLWCWGNNGAGRLGDGTGTNRLAPVQVGTDTNWSTVNAGRDHTCGTKTDGTLWCWGYNGNGAVGDGTTTHRSSPTQVGTDTDWSTISAGFRFSCGTKTNGTLWCWGDNASSHLGDGTSVQRLSPVQIGVATTWRSVSTGVNSSCGTRTDDTLWCWGTNGFGQLGDGTTSNRSTPGQSGTGYKTVAMGESHACGIDTSDKLWCWGRNNLGQLGLGTTTDHWSPQAALHLGPVSTISLGYQHTMALASPATPTYVNLGGNGSWLAANDLAEAHGGKLVQIDDAAENQYVYDKFWTGTNLHLNATDVTTEGSWRNNDGDLLTYTNWATGEPNNCCGGQDYGAMWSGGTWDDAQENGWRLVIVEYGP